MLKTISLLLVLCAGVCAQTPAPTNPLVQWNRNLLGLVRTPGAQPSAIHPTRSFAIMHAAIYDAVNAIDGTHRPYFVQLRNVSAGASQEAAAVSAAHEALIGLYPNANLRTTLDAKSQESLAQIPDGSAKDQGIAIGQLVADQLLALRGNDGSNAAPVLFVFGNAPGDTRRRLRISPTRRSPNGRKSLILTSSAYADAFNEIKAFGIARSSAATTDQALTGRFWNGAIQNYWNEIAQQAALANDLTTARSTRLFSLLNLTFADSVIAFYHAKYTYDVWRPITAALIHQFFRSRG